MKTAKCLVRPGMRVEVPPGDGDFNSPGTVVHALPECCVVRLDSKPRYSGMFVAVEWDTVKVLNPAPELEPESAGGAVYYPELRTWFDMSVNNPRESFYMGPRTFGIHEAMPAGNGEDECHNPGPRVAILTVDPAIDQESANRIAGLVCNAPALWRELRTQNRHRLSEDNDQLEIFERATQILMDAAKRPPYESARDNPDDKIFSLRSDGTIAAMKGGEHAV